MAETLSERFANIAARSTLIRGNQGFGRKPNKSALSLLAESGPVSVHHYDDATGKTTIDRVQNVSPVIDANKAEYASGHDGYTPSRDLKRVASVPLIIVEQWLKEGVDIFNRDHWTKVAAKLDDPEYQFFRTSPGKISRKPLREFLSARRRSR